MYYKPYKVGEDKAVNGWQSLYDGNTRIGSITISNTLLVELIRNKRVLEFAVP